MLTVNDADRTETLITPEEFRAALARFCSGVTVVSVSVGKEAHAMTATAFCSLSLEPPSILVCVANQARMNALLLGADRFGVSILRDDQAHYSMCFGGRPSREAVPEFEQLGNVPVLPGALVKLECRRSSAHLEGGHTIFVGHVLASKIVDGEPLTYFEGDYQRLMR
ncbi:flavin reductase family protein [Kineobactrum salinum]|uniref:Flavin reductase family protein n=2 Tax=Kineobactrum salinum TaxID=2708301 RepID=A0A6C0U8Q7_9GAMM|nr:flavin reductase family protein [Kineobactrum salinum]